MKITQPLKWHGGKHYLAPKIVALMPLHIHYVEPYAGGLSVLLAKDPDGDCRIWIDMESGVRSDDWFDLSKVKVCLEIAQKHVRVEA